MSKRRGAACGNAPNPKIIQLKECVETIVGKSKKKDIFSMVFMDTETVDPSGHSSDARNRAIVAAISLFEVCEGGCRNPDLQRVEIIQKDGKKYEICRYRMHILRAILNGNRKDLEAMLLKLRSLLRKLYNGTLIFCAHNAGFDLLKLHTAELQVAAVCSDEWLEQFHQTFTHDTQQGIDMLIERLYSDEMVNAIKEIQNKSKYLQRLDTQFVCGKQVSLNNACDMYLNEKKIELKYNGVPYPNPGRLIDLSIYQEDKTRTDILEMVMEYCLQDTKLVAKLLMNETAFGYTIKHERHRGAPISHAFVGRMKDLISALQQSTMLNERGSAGPQAPGGGPSSQAAAASGGATSRVQSSPLDTPNSDAVTAKAKRKKLWEEKHTEPYGSSCDDDPNGQEHPRLKESDDQAGCAGDGKRPKAAADQGGCAGDGRRLRTAVPHEAVCAGDGKVQIVQPQAAGAPAAQSSAASAPARDRFKAGVFGVPLTGEIFSATEEQMDTTVPLTDENAAKIVETRMRRHGEMKGKDRIALKKPATAANKQEVLGVAMIYWDLFVALRKYDGVLVLITVTDPTMKGDKLDGKLTIKGVTSGRELCITEPLKSTILAQIGEMVDVSSTTLPLNGHGKSYKWEFYAELAKRPTEDSEKDFHSILAYYGRWLSSWVFEAHMQAAEACLYLIFVWVVNLTQPEEVIEVSFEDWLKMTAAYRKEHSDHNHGLEMWKNRVVDVVRPIEANNVTECDTSNREKTKSFIDEIMKIGAAGGYEGIVFVALRNKKGEKLCPQFTPTGKEYEARMRQQKQVQFIKGKKYMSSEMTNENCPYTMNWIKVKESSRVGAYVYALRETPNYYVLVVAIQGIQGWVLKKALPILKGKFNVPGSKGVKVTLNIIRYTLNPTSTVRYVVLIPTSQTPSDEESLKIVRQKALYRQYIQLQNQPDNSWSRYRDIDEKTSGPPVTYTRVGAKEYTVDGKIKQQFHYIRDENGPPGSIDKVWFQKDPTQDLDKIDEHKWHHQLKQRRPDLIIQGIMYKNVTMIQNGLINRRQQRSQRQYNKEVQLGLANPQYFEPYNWRAEMETLNRTRQMRQEPRIGPGEWSSDDERPAKRKEISPPCSDDEDKMDGLLVFDGKEVQVGHVPQSDGTASKSSHS
jgi:hypothetical protein